ncbi:MAG: flagellar protein FlgN [Oceanospirillaceae bacterium]|nr:flagellar protein FlgN [Oceanospirillaceae bacterium]
MNRDNLQKFDTLTLSGIQILSDVSEVLKAELTALTHRDLEQIKKCATDKSKLLSDFSENIRQRTHLLQINNFEATAASISAFINSSDNSSEILVFQTNWKNLETSLQTVINANSVNEQVLSRNQKNLDTILSILQGQQANNILYTAKGNKGDYAGQSRIGKA